MKRLLLAVTFMVAFFGCVVAQFDDEHDEHPAMPWSFTDEDNDDAVTDMDSGMTEPDVAFASDDEEARKWEKPWFCRDHDCPKFEMKKKTAEYEIRAYQESRWVTNAVKHQDDLPKAYMRLFKYIRGKNKDKKKLDMTVPVLVMVLPCPKKEDAFDEPHDEIDESFGDSKCCHMFNVSFYVPNKFQGDRKPPMPVEEKLTVKKMPEAMIAVRPFPGWASRKTVMRELRTLKRWLDKEKIEYDMKEGFGFAAYDPPHRSHHRHNEVWIPIKKMKDDTTNIVF